MHLYHLDILFYHIFFNGARLFGNSMSQAQAQQKAFAEYDVFNRTQRINSDFDKQIKRLTEQQ